MEGMALKYKNSRQKIK